MLARLERILFAATRLSTLVAVLASWCGAVLLFALGVGSIFSGFAAQSAAIGTDLPRSEATVVYLIGGLDRFLLAVVLLYFGYGLYGLFIRPNRPLKDIGLPDWLHVDSIGELKQTVAEVIIVVLFVLFLRVALETFHQDGHDLTWTTVGQVLLLPVSILLLAGALRLAEFNPKRGARSKRSKDGEGA